MDPGQIGEITYRGQPPDDPGILDRTPQAICDLLAQTNGFILFHGGLHVRGACHEPAWHSLRAAWEGAEAFHRLYTAVEAEDVPFAQDCVGDQFLLRNGRVLQLSAESDEIEDLGMTLEGFFDAVQHDAEEFLCFDPKRRLEPGQLLHAYPPFCMKPDGGDVSLRPVPAHELLHFHAVLARKIRDLPDGAEITIDITE